ncbi:MAG TPA: DUF882 domain-containing protein [Thermopetrobacter sp.]|nr:DUF882 domain-containing protein [Thermopetrobacter sp.]
MWFEKRFAAALLLAALAPSAEAGWLNGNTAGLHPALKAKLHRLHKAYGRPIHVTPQGGCRARGNRRAPKSWHRRAVGCKAADIVIPGVSRRTILAWWGRNIGGGRGFYCGRRFVHVDIGPARTWTWYCQRRTRIARRR